MGDWIDDVFYELNGRVVDEATRYRLEDLLETAMMEDGEERVFMDRIHADDLTDSRADPRAHIRTYNCADIDAFRISHDQTDNCA